MTIPEMINPPEQLMPEWNRYARASRWRGRLFGGRWIITHRALVSADQPWAEANECIMYQRRTLQGAKHIAWDRVANIPMRVPGEGWVIRDRKKGGRLRGTNAARGFDREGRPES